MPTPGKESLQYFPIEEFAGVADVGILEKARNDAEDMRAEGAQMRLGIIETLKILIPLPGSN